MNREIEWLHSITIVDYRLLYHYNYNYHHYSMNFH
jgi:hypothetical protein